MQAIFPKRRMIAWFNTFSARAISIGLVVTCVIAATMLTSTPAQMPEQARRICRNAIVGLAGTPASMLEVSSRPGFDKIVVDIRVNKSLDLGDGAFADGHIGTCSFNRSGELINIDTFVYSAQSPSHFKDFGDVPNIGRFIVILRSRRAGKGEVLEEGRLRPVTPPGEDIAFPYSTNLYYNTVGRDFKDETAIFPVLIHDRQEHWWANCLSKYMGKLDAARSRLMPPIAPKALVKAVVPSVC
jgi:hypothetical protein